MSSNRRTRNVNIVTSMYKQIDLNLEHNVRESVSIYLSLDKLIADIRKEKKNQTILYLILYGQTKWMLTDTHLISSATGKHAYSTPLEFYSSSLRLLWNKKWKWECKWKNWKYLYI